MKCRTSQIFSPISVENRDICNINLYIFWLVVWTPLKNISQLGWLFQIYGKIKHGNQTTNQYLYTSCATNPPVPGNPSGGSQPLACAGPLSTCSIRGRVDASVAIGFQLPAATIGRDTSKHRRGSPEDADDHWGYDLRSPQAGNWKITILSFF